MAVDNAAGIGKDDRMAYKRGMVIVAKPDGWQWGAKESREEWLNQGRPANEWPDKFNIIRIPDLDEPTSRALERAQFEDDDGVDRRGAAVFLDKSPDNATLYTPQRIRSYKIDLDNLSFDEHGAATINRGQLVSALQRASGQGRPVDGQGNLDIS